MYAEFCEQLVTHPEGWQETGLPRKGDHPPLPNNKAGSSRPLPQLQLSCNTWAWRRSMQKPFNKETQESNPLAALIQAIPGVVPLPTPTNPVKTKLPKISWGCNNLDGI